MENEKIVRFIREELTDSERLEVLKWIEDSDEHKAVFSELKNTMILADSFEKDRKSMLMTQEMRLSHDAGPFRVQRMLGYAATILILVAMGMLFFLENHKVRLLANNDIEYIVPNGQTSNIVLADGSRVYLNSGSTLKQYGSYALSKRELYLEGEAFFDVATNKKKPFIIRTPSFSVIATGTEFNVRTYSNSDISDVTLVSGKVEIDIGDESKPVVLSNGETASINRNTGEYRLSQIEGAQYTSWKEGIITFRDTRLEDLAKMLERTYNVIIVFSDEKTKDMMYSGTMLRYKPVDQILDILEMTSDVRFEIETRINEPNLIIVKTRKPM